MAKQSNKLPAISESFQTHLNVYGARVHNLKNIDVSIPRNKLVVITGISGSGKSSLAFDTIYAEGQRRYLESFSAYARQFIGNMERPDVDKITGLSPVISIEQKTTNRNPRSTVGTITEVYDFMRLLFARIGDAYSYNTGKKMVRFSEDQIIEHLLEKFDGKRLIVLAPVVRGRKGHYRELFEQIRKQGFLKVRVDGVMIELKKGLQVDRYKIHDIEVVIDRLKVAPDNLDRIRNSVKQALKMGNDLLMIMNFETEEVFSFSKKLVCPDTGISYEEPSPNTFSFNSPYGYCQNCKGLGYLTQASEELMIPDSTKSINKGGIGPLGEYRDNSLFKQLKSLARKYKFSLSSPVKEIPEKVLQIILFGEEGKSQTASNEDVDDIDKWYTITEGGVVSMLKRAYNGSTSDSIRRWAESYMEQVPCNSCNGNRLKSESLYFKVGEKNISELAQMSIEKLIAWFSKVDSKLTERQLFIGKEVLKEIRMRTQFLYDVGLEYLTLNRASRTLSGGESQRIRLATQIGSKLVGITYILDEPSIGLHQRDNERLINALRDLTNAGNTVIVVEHDKEIMERADFIIDIGPKAGEHGGQLVGIGSPEEFKKTNTITAKYLKDDVAIEEPESYRIGSGEFFELNGAQGNNLRNLNVKFPLGKFIGVTGVSGSGKSTLINETLYPILNKHIYRSRKKPLKYKSVKGLKLLDKVIEIDQSPIGRTPRSNPATYIGVFTDIRMLYAQVPEAKIRGYKPGRFSFNVKTGRCNVCEGGGLKAIKMNFLPDVHVTCEKCLGKRYNRETLEIRFKGKSISDVLEMTVDDASAFFENQPKIYRRLKTLHEVGLGYIRLGQQATTLSGGEAQRVKLSSELSKKDTGQTFYILDEPTTGLHFEDIKMLLKVLNKLVDKGNTVLVIEHNLDIIKTADWIIDLGPEGGEGGGNIIFEGTPRDIINCKESFTGTFLKKELKTIN